jgi:transposase InsO family protein
LRLLSNIVPVVIDALALARNLLRSQSALAVENLFLRKQLTFFVEREQTPYRTDNGTRFTMAALSRMFDWKNALIVVKPDTLIRWHRKGFRLFWRWKSRPKGRPTLPEELKKLIAEMAVANITWGEERIAHELLVKLGVRVSPRTVRKYMPNRDDGGGARHSSQRWATFVRNHAKAIVAADFLTVVTARFQFLYVLVVMEVGTRKIVHVNVTTHPTAEWTLQQFREAIPCEHDYRFVIVDRDTKFSEDLRKSVRAMGVRVLRTPAFAPQANSYCERLLGTTRRECLDYLIPLSEIHLRRVLLEWRDYYNRARPHSSLGPSVPEPMSDLPVDPSSSRHSIPTGFGVVSRPILGGLHHDYRLARAA